MEWTGQGDGVTSLVIEHFDMPVTRREVRALGAAGDRAGDVLAGRTVWCATALPSARRSADDLRDRMEGAAPGLAAASMQVTADDQLSRVAERLDDMLAGATPAQSGLGPAEQDLYSEGARASEDLVGNGVGADDVVVVHDALSAIFARAVRERGAHAVWRVHVGGTSGATAREALEFLHDFTAGVDAYILTWRERGPRGDIVERVAAAMPSAGIVAAKEYPVRVHGDDARRMAWRTALAEIVRGDRGECVGGTLHPRPTVAAR
jgi:hypothetical protein